MKITVLLGIMAVGVLALVPRVSPLTVHVNTRNAAELHVVSLMRNCSPVPCNPDGFGRIQTPPSWAPMLEPITMFLGGTGLMGFGWVVWRRRLFSGPRPVAGQTIVQDRIINASD
jgi:hypothetical protein